MLHLLREICYNLYSLVQEGYWPFFEHDTFTAQLETNSVQYCRIEAESLPQSELPVV